MMKQELFKFLGSWGGKLTCACSGALTGYIFRDMIFPREEKEKIEITKAEDCYTQRNYCEG